MINTYDDQLKSFYKCYPALIPNTYSDIIRIPYKNLLSDKELKTNLKHVRRRKETIL